jgi:hypothetical protein
MKLIKMPSPKVLSASRELAIAESIDKNKKRKEEIERRIKREQEYLFGKEKKMTQRSMSEPIKISSRM